MKRHQFFSVARTLTIFFFSIKNHLFCIFSSKFDKMMKQYFLAITLLFMVCLGHALKEEDCEGGWLLDRFGQFFKFSFCSYHYINDSISLFHQTVCVKTINEFVDTHLQDDAIKTDPKAIEEAFKQYCLTAKSKQQRLVSIALGQLANCALTWPNRLTETFLRIIAVLLFRRFRNIGHWHFRWNVKTIELAYASA